MAALALGIIGFGIMGERLLTQALPHPEFRLSGVWDTFVVGPELAAALQAHDGPVLLVDDLVDSRWTMTVAGRELRRAGASAVLPFALATVA